MAQISTISVVIRYATFAVLLGQAERELHVGAKGAKPVFAHIGKLKKVRPDNLRFANASGNAINQEYPFNAASAATRGAPINYRAPVATRRKTGRIK